MSATPTRGPALYFESAAVIITLVLLGQLLELRARGRASGAIRELLDLAPPTAIRIEADGEREVALDSVVTGDRLRVRPGARFRSTAVSKTVRARSTNRC